MTEEGDF